MSAKPGATCADVVILCGGRGSRMGGLDKGWVTLAGAPLVAWVHQAVAAQTADFGAIHISANRELDRYQALGVSVLVDRQPDFPGPLAGIDAAFAHSKATWLWVVPCDMPLLPVEMLDRLQQAILETNAPMAVVTLDGHPQPANCLVHRQCWPALQAQMQAGQGALWRWQQRCGAVYVPFEHADAMPNLNTPEALAALETTLSQLIQK